jgi:hypothetical protein
LKVVALVDPNGLARQRTLENKRASFVELAYRDTLEFAGLEEFIDFAKVVLRGRWG